MLATCGLGGGERAELAETGWAARATHITHESERPEPVTALPSCGAPVADIADKPLRNAPVIGRSSYRIPSEGERDALREAIEATSRRRLSAARERAEAAGYQLCRVPESDDEHGDTVVLRPAVDEDGHALIVWRLGRAQPLVLEAPHPHHDSGTGWQALRWFEALGARALLISGTYRCSNAGVPSGCDGATSTCGGVRPYTESDMAHTVSTFFQQAHEALFERYPQATMLSVHGMAADGISLSDGTVLSTTASAPVAQLAQAFRRELRAELVTTCNTYPGANVRPTRCGTTNTQGRHANGVGDACNERASISSGRFIHLEQSLEVRAQPGALLRALHRWLHDPEERLAGQAVSSAHLQPR